MEATTTSTTTLLRGWADKEPVAKEEVESKETTCLSNDDTTLENDKTNNEASLPSENINFVSSKDGDGNKKPSYFNGFVATVLKWVRLLRLTNWITWISFLISIEVESRNIENQMGRDFVFYYSAAVMVHEVGHAIVMLMLGVEFYPIIFVPFFGAFVTPKTFSQNVFDEAMIAAGGPILGTLAAVLLAMVGKANNSVVLVAASYASFVGNISNLGSRGDLDGGRIVSVISPWLALLSTALFVAKRGKHLSEIEFTRLSLQVEKFYFRIMGDHKAGHGPSNGKLYYNVSWTCKLLLAVFYIGLNDAVPHVSNCIGDPNTDMSVCAGIWLLCCCVFFGYVYRLGKSQSIDSLVSSIEIVSSKEEEEETSAEEEETSAATNTETNEPSVDSPLEQPDEVDRNGDTVNHGEDKYKVE